MRAKKKGANPRKLKKQAIINTFFYNNVKNIHKTYIRYKKLQNTESKPEFKSNVDFRL